MQVDYPGAIGMWVPIADMFTANTHQAIVIHKTASGNTAQAIAQYFINASIGPSVHYVIGLDGTIVQCVPEAMGAGGNGILEAGHDPFWDQFGRVNLNTVTLSIEHVDPSPSNSTPCPQAQIDASFKLVLHLAQKYHIAPDHIKPHSSLEPINRARCPGNYPFAELLAYVQKGGKTMGVPQGWSDDGHTLTAPNGHRVILGFRDHVLNVPSWDADNQPLDEEYHTNQVLLHDTSIGAGQVQLFRDTMLWYTPTQSVVQEPCLGLEIKAAYDLISTLQPTSASQPPIDAAQAIAALRALQANGDAAIVQILKTLHAQ